MTVLQKRKQNRLISIRKPEIKSVEKCIKITVKLTNRGHTVVQDFLIGMEIDKKTKPITTDLSISYESLIVSLRVVPPVLP